jgi:guanylate kinase
MSNEGRGLLFIVSAPSGTGKTTVVRGLVETTPDIRMSQSYTARPPRPGERDGFDYHFVTAERFEAMRDAGEFLEWAVVFGQLYGTRAPDAEQVLASGQDLVLVIDVQGARKVRQKGVPSIGIFLLPPSLGALEVRLRRRSQDSEIEIGRRLEVARQEVSAYPDYDYLVVNERVGDSVDRLRAIVLAERARLSSMRPKAEAILSEFGATRA